MELSSSKALIGVPFAEDSLSGTLSEHKKTELSSSGTLFGVLLEEGSTSRGPIVNLKWNYPLAKLCSAFHLWGAPFAELRRSTINGNILWQNSVRCTTQGGLHKRNSNGEPKVELSSSGALIGVPLAEGSISGVLSEYNKRSYPLAELRLVYYLRRAPQAELRSVYYMRRAIQAELRSVYCLRRAPQAEVRRSPERRTFPLKELRSDFHLRMALLAEHHRNTKSGPLYKRS